MNESAQQLRDLYASMSPAARLTAGLLMAVIVISVGYLFQQRSSGPGEYLFAGEGLQPREADAVMAAIAKAKLNGAERVGNRIRVPSDKQAEYLGAVASNGAMPANFDTLMDEAINVSPFMPQKLQQQRIKSVRERKLSMIVRNMDGIQDAKVMYDVREAQGFSKRMVTATVSVRPTAGEGLNARRGKMIRMAVAGAIGGLKPDDVTILDQSSGSEFAGGGSEISAEDFDDPYYRTRILYERNMQGRIANLLHDIPGIRIQVNAELDKTIQRSLETVRSEGEAVAIHEQSKTDSTLSERIEDGNQPGLVAQGPGRSAPEEEVAKLVNKTEKADNHTDSFVPTTQEHIVESGLVPLTVKASIAIPSEYLVRVWRQRNPDAGEDDQPPQDRLDIIEDDTKRRVKESVSELLPKRVTEDTLQNVAVTILPSLTPEAIEEPSLASTGMLWASDHFNTLLTAGFAIVGLVMLRSVVKSIPVPESAPAVASAPVSVEQAPAAAEDPRSGETAEERRPKLKLKKGSNLREDLTEIVREDPDTAAAILRSWISNAG